MFTLDTYPPCPLGCVECEISLRKRYIDFDADLETLPENSSPVLTNIRTENPPLCETPQLTSVVEKSVTFNDGAIDIPENDKVYYLHDSTEDSGINVLDSDSDPDPSEILDIIHTCDEGDLATALLILPNHPVLLSLKTLLSKSKTLQREAADAAKKIEGSRGKSEGLLEERIEVAGTRERGYRYREILYWEGNGN